MLESSEAGLERLAKAKVDFPNLDAFDFHSQSGSCRYHREPERCSASTSRSNSRVWFRRTLAHAAMRAFRSAMGPTYETPKDGVSTEVIKQISARRARGESSV